MEPKLLTREQFREGVFARDGHKCVFCGKTAAETPEGKLDAHHILERRLWPDGGYYLENGATVCEEHHLECEQTVRSVEDVRNAAGITKILVPPHLYDDHVYDKWGNPVHDRENRTNILQGGWRHARDRVECHLLHRRTSFTLTNLEN